ncbi:MAG: NUDIX hydrolase [Vreelandella alkaliphila]|uniref:DNA mismatch repair protein MutT n=1 Tax=Halomonas campaniensis TaxID=213554 RepID=A0A3D0KJ21_9GAMM|nr:MULTISPECIES: NUDIX domain-containing protein [unclassified Halomonas]HBP41683.1 DNA mismatch repair protein MutT [Halomonas sp.]HBS81577.1 DNA mismatch repair protein MutT [Halomonas campaniensis]HCA03201.1 DNA mismatch repair protein MutT [Halomonas campaniensis]
MPGNTDKAQNLLKIAAAVVSDSSGRLLLVRKQGTRFFMQPGGKIELGEEAIAALCRELEEEIGLRITGDQLLPLGMQRALAANEPDTVIEAQLFSLMIDQPVHAGAEIAETTWVTREEALKLPLAPLTKQHVVVAA